jgi:transcriptional regulator with XRE-family HTH domain
MTQIKSIPEVLKLSLTSEQLRAARALLRWEQRNLAEASGVSLPTVKRLETQPGELAAQERTIVELRKALETAGIYFIAENGGGAGVRLKTRASSRSKKT